MLDGRLLVDAHVHVARLPTLSAGLAILGAGVRRPPRSPGCSTPRAVPRPEARSTSTSPARAPTTCCCSASTAPRRPGSSPSRTCCRWSAANPDRFRPVASINPHLHYPPAAELARQVGLGAVACKIHPVHGGFEAGDRMLYPAYAWARGARPAGHRALRHLHVRRVGQRLRRPGAARPGVPRLPRPHRGAGARRPGLVVRAGRVPGPDAAAGAGWRSPGCRRGGCPTTTAPSLRRLASKMIFGTDWPGVPGVQRNARALEKVLLEAGCTADEVAAALGGNAAGVFGLQAGRPGAGWPQTPACPVTDTGPHGPFRCPGPGPAGLRCHGRAEAVQRAVR